MRHGTSRGGTTPRRQRAGWTDRMGLVMQAPGVAQAWKQIDG